jgi:hypothetical protein
MPARRLQGRDSVSSWPTLSSGHILQRQRDGFKVATCHADERPSRRPAPFNASATASKSRPEANCGDHIAPVAFNASATASKSRLQLLVRQESYRSPSTPARRLQSRDEDCEPGVALTASSFNASATASKWRPEANCGDLHRRRPLQRQRDGFKVATRRPSCRTPSPPWPAFNASATASKSRRVEPAHRRLLHFIFPYAFNASATASKSRPHQPCRLRCFQSHLQRQRDGFKVATRTPAPRGTQSPYLQRQRDGFKVATTGGRRPGAPFASLQCQRDGFKVATIKSDLRSERLKHGERNAARTSRPGNCCSRPT